MSESYCTRPAPGAAWELDTAPPRPPWDARITAALAARDRRALHRVAREAATHASYYPGATGREASRAHARALAALRYLPPRQPGRRLLRRLGTWWPR